jgi:hypothetical protein
MSKHDKLIKRFLAHPLDFTWDEMTALLTGFGYARVKAGKTGGSRSFRPSNIRSDHPASATPHTGIEAIPD